MQHITVVIPAFNAAPYLAATLDSVLGQTYSEWEALVVDDGSTDDTAGVIARYAKREPRIRACRRVHGGVAAARNWGARVAVSRSSLLAFLDADDLWEPDALEILRATLEDRPEAPAAHGLAAFLDEGGRPMGDGRTINGGPAGAETTHAMMALACTFYPPGAALVRRAAFWRVGGFDESLAHAEDWDLWLRLCRLGDIAFTRRRVVWYRQRPGSLSAQAEAAAEGRWRVAEKHGLTRP